MRKSLILWLSAILSLSLLLGLLFVANSFWTGSHTTESGLASPLQASNPIQEIRLMSYNIRWCKESENCLDRVAALIEDEKPDIVFLAATYYECAQCPVENQVAYLAKKTGLHAYAFGENYSWGIPFYRNRSGNALLSRFPLRVLYAQHLSGGGYDPRSTRRTLWAEVEINGENILVGSVHNSYSNQEKNLGEVGKILGYVGDRSTLLGGDFNTTPESPSMQAIRRSKLFIGDFEGPKTYPSSKPDQRLDYILAPASWRLLDHKTLDSKLSAHLPVVSTFAIPINKEGPP